MATATSSPIMTKPDCPDKCGNITVPYPFGLGKDPSCYREGFQLLCNHTFTPSKLFLQNTRIWEDTEGVEWYGHRIDKLVEVEEISLQGQLRVYSFMNYRCYDDSFVDSHMALNTSLISVDMRDTPFALSDTGNILTGIGCGILADVASSNGSTTVSYQYLRFRYGCYSQCKDKNGMLNGTYPAMGYCQTNNTKGLKSFYGILKGEYQFYKNFSPCAYSFVADYKWYNFSIDHLSDFGFYTRNKGMVPTILDWAIENDSCKNITMRNNVTYACGENSGCHDSHNGLGYLCECLEGYQGNPYLQDGCQGM
uniref:Wall-associated receptor kinase galacturonan-binding domain-containing protein n=1 Tax=Nelumbo nucifera TaxID=4432 RepID=A0A822YFM9_NELNU|nr:TPA_asm: hypothetical protein HUJ06_031749 [Nelumbo nucifera]